MISERLRFEASMGSPAEFLIPGFARAAASPKTEMCLSKGRKHTKML